MLYRVTWTVDLEADSAREAAEKARAAQMRPGTAATVFEVEHYDTARDMAISEDVDLRETDETGEPAGLNAFLNAYVTTALWSSTDSEGEHLDRWRDYSDIHPDTLTAMHAECAAFLAANRADIGNRLAEAGHDFWLTRNGHGAGFRDGDWPEPAASRLDGASKAAGTRDLCIGDDGAIHQA